MSKMFTQAAYIAKSPFRSLVKTINPYPKVDTPPPTLDMICDRQVKITTKNGGPLDENNFYQKG